MSHQIIIRNAVASVFDDPEVRSEFTPAQLDRVDSICAQAVPCDEDFRYLTRRLNQVYCQDD